MHIFDGVYLRVRWCSTEHKMRAFAARGWIISDGDQFNLKPRLLFARIGRLR
jgi:hypothetical protein